MDAQETALERACFWPCVVGASGFGAASVGLVLSWVFGGWGAWVIAGVGGGVAFAGFAALTCADNRLQSYRESKRQRFLKEGPDFS